LADATQRHRRSTDRNHKYESTPNYRQLLNSDAAAHQPSSESGTLSARRNVHAVLHQDMTPVNAIAPLIATEVAVTRPKRWLDGAAATQNPWNSLIRRALPLQRCFSCESRHPHCWSPPLRELLRKGRPSHRHRRNGRYCPPQEPAGLRETNLRAEPSIESTGGGGATNWRWVSSRSRRFNRRR
jgi:hypothetical protein